MQALEFQEWLIQAKTNYLIFKAKHKTQNMAIAKQKPLQSITRCI